jgi:hypothetical protein
LLDVKRVFDILETKANLLPVVLALRARKQENQQANKTPGDGGAGDDGT